MPPRIEKTVFISYRRANKPWALFIYQYLNDNGYDVFIDFQNINSGNFETTILANIKARAHFIVILTPSALENCNKPGDWLRREIETAMEEKRNIIPMMVEGFDFGSPLVKNALTGKLTTLSSINGLRIPDDYPFEAMERLRNRYLNVALSDVDLPILLGEEQKFTEFEITKANKAEHVQDEQLTAQTWFERGYVFQNDKNLEEALRCYSEAVRLDPTLYYGYNNLGVSLNELKHYEEAEAAYHKAIEINPSEAIIYSNLGVLFKELKRYEEGEAAYRKAIELNPSDTTAYYNLSVLLRVTGRECKALPIFEKMIEISPENFKAYLGIASIKKTLGVAIEPSLINNARQYIPEDDFYSKACLESVYDHIDLAFEYLLKASKNEKFDPSWTCRDPDLQWIRNDPRFEQIVGEKPTQ
jgi:tetratricopeptide (TPR) repeat protein